MIAGLSGSLLSHDALLRGPVTTQRADPHHEAACRRLAAWHRSVRSRLGPTATAREVFDRIALPFVAELGYHAVPTNSSALPTAILHASTRPTAALIVTAWGQDAASAWHFAVRHGIASGVRWCLCFTGPTLRIVDAHRTYSRRFANFDLNATVEDERALRLMWRLLAAAEGGAVGVDGGLDAAVRISESHRAEVRGALQTGVHGALAELLQAFANAARRAPLDRAFEEALTVIYRMLFLLFAEARGLVPQWHPIYRDSYTIERLRGPVERLVRPRGLWESLQAVARLAHHGCRAGSLRVPPFNGRLFSPAHAPLADAVPLDDGAVRDALLALTTRPASSGRERISYADLGVEHLGGVYERLLEFEPAVTQRRTTTLVRAERRKATGSFYTPRSLTEFLVRRTLAPLVAGAMPEQILELRVLDPAMGSGAFLVAACRYLAAAYESALVDEGLSSSDITPEDRAAFRRTVAQRCLFGVDINPTAVQLARLSLWLATLAADRPLTFLDHHLRTGNSLAGASIDDVMRRRPGRTGANRITDLPLFPSDGLDRALRAASVVRTAITEQPGDTIEQVRSKEHALATVRAECGLAPWVAIADLWCAAWFDEARGPALQQAFGALADGVLRDDASLPAHVAAPLLEGARAVAAREQFFHWTLEFPEVLDASSARPAGFDAIIGNPPWEMLRGDRGSEECRAAARSAGSRLATFARTSGTFLFPGEGHANLFQLFVDRALSLVRRGGRIGLVLPWGFATDVGCAMLRRHMLDRTAIDTFVSIDNRDAVFPIHRSVRILLLTSTAGGSTTALPCRLGLRSPEELDACADTGTPDMSVNVPRSLVEQFSGPAVAVPDIRSAGDLKILSSITCSVPALGDPDGWNVHFGRELNASDDRRHFTSGEAGLPVVEGKDVAPFTVDLTAIRNRVPEHVAATLVDPQRTYRRARLAYRDVASATNRLTLIAAIVPAGAITTHTLFCLREDLGEEAQQFLSGVFNSYVANYLVRLRVTTHVSAAVIDRLPVPKPPASSAAFQEVARLSALRAERPDAGNPAATLQARVARLYGLDAESFRHVLGTFPLVDRDVREAAMARFRDF